MKKLAGLMLGAALALSPMSAGAECDKAQARSIVDSIVQGGLATRKFVNVTTYYQWKKNWYSLSYEKQRRLIGSLAGVEQCLRGGPVTTRIVYMGEEVAKGGPGGVFVMKSRP